VLVVAVVVMLHHLIHLQFLKTKDATEAQVVLLVEELVFTGQVLTLGKVVK
tara:strand:- start:776 stop:928 length:153 start_codon:yes stop_codon:yes gene_type:complete